jgi:hypothetical protein
MQSGLLSHINEISATCAYIEVRQEHERIIHAWPTKTAGRANLNFIFIQLIPLLSSEQPLPNGPVLVQQKDIFSSSPN